jgi:hypothetical protein
MQHHHVIQRIADISVKSFCAAIAADYSVFHFFARIIYGQNFRADVGGNAILNYSIKFEPEIRGFVSESQSNLLYGYNVSFDERAGWQCE